MFKSRWTAAAFAVFAFAASAHAQVPLEALPGEDVNAPPPYEEYENKEIPVDKSWMTYNDPYLESQRVISNPHRTSEEVGDWAKGLAADLMTQSPGQIEEKIRNYRKSFNEKGYNEYVTYMRDAKVIDMVSLRKYELSSIVNGDAAFAGSGPVGGVYTWNVSIPLLISFYQKDESGDHKTVAGGNFRLEMRIARTPAGENDNGMVIDGWRVVRN